MEKPELEYYDEWGAMEFLQQLIEEWNDQYEDDENLQIDMPEEGSDLEDYVEAIEQVDCHGRQVVWLPCYDEADRQMVCLVGC